MSGQPWRYALASVVGTAHAGSGQPCQDASACRTLATAAGAPILIAVAADGAGSAPRAGEGAALACARSVEALAGYLAGGGALAGITPEVIRAWLGDFQAAIGQRAADAGRQPRDFACTLLGAIVGGEGAVFWQIGDGAIVVDAAGDGEDYAWVFWPQHGEFANTTTFATAPEALTGFAYARQERPIADLAIFTDGIERLALHIQTRRVHAPFFRPLFRPLRGGAPGHDAPLSAALAHLLASPHFNDRTDDDKTLILATRGAGAAD